MILPGNGAVIKERLTDRQVCSHPALTSHSIKNDRECSFQTNLTKVNKRCNMAFELTLNG